MLNLVVRKETDRLEKVKIRLLVLMLQALMCICSSVTKTLVTLNVFSCGLTD